MTPDEIVQKTTAVEHFIRSLADEIISDNLPYAVTSWSKGERGNIRLSVRITTSGLMYGAHHDFNHLLLDEATKPREAVISHIMTLIQRVSYKAFLKGTISDGKA